MAKKKQEDTANESTDVAVAEPPAELTLQPTLQQQRVSEVSELFAAANLAANASFDNFGDDPVKRLGFQSLCKSSETQPMEKMPAEGVIVRHYYMHVAQVNQRGKNELKPAIRTVIMDNDQNLWHSMSEYVARDVIELVKATGGGEITQNIRVKFESVKAGANTVNKLVFLPE